MTDKAINIIFPEVLYWFTNFTSTFRWTAEFLVNETQFGRVSIPRILIESNATELRNGRGLYANVLDRNKNDHLSFNTRGDHNAKED